MANGLKQHSGGPRLGYLLYTVFCAWGALAGVVLAVAAPGPIAVKVIVLGGLAFAVAVVAAWYHGYRCGCRRPVDDLTEEP